MRPYLKNSIDNNNQNIVVFALNLKYFYIIQFSVSFEVDF